MCFAFLLIERSPEVMDVTDLHTSSEDTSISFSAHPSRFSSWTDEETDECTGVETIREDPLLPTDAKEGNDNDSDIVEAGSSSGKKRYSETVWMFKLRRNLDQLDSIHQQKEHNMLKAREELEACHLHISELERQRDRVEQDMQLQKEADNCAAVFRLQAHHKRLCQEIHEEEELKAYVATTLRKHELALCQVEVELGRFSWLSLEVQQEELAYQALQAQREEARMMQEDTAIRGLQLQAQSRKLKQKATQMKEETHCQRAKEQAQISHQKAVLFLKKTMKRMHQEEAMKEKQSLEQKQNRIQAVLSLKANISATQESLMRAQKKKSQAQKQEEEERPLGEYLQAQAANSTKHIHQQRKLQEFHRKKAKFEKKQKSNQVKIVSKLLLEERLLERHKRHQVLFPPTPVSLVVRHRKSSKKECLPSAPQLSQQGTLFSDNSSSSKLSEEEESRHMENDQGLTDSLAQPEFTGLWDQSHEVHQSKLWEEAMSLQLQPATQDMFLLPEGKPPMACKTVLHGKEFKGEPFISKPQTIVFKDFEVGKMYKKKVILTNVSYTTNYCKLLGVTMDLIDFISISFEPPGPISAGIACDMLVTFKPMINKDFKGEVQFLSSAGPFSVPIRCTIKKCDPFVDNSLIDFGTHVVGQTISRAITLNNRGALRTRFSLVPIPSPVEHQVQAQTLSDISAGRIQLSQERRTSVQANSAGLESPALQDREEHQLLMETQKSVLDPNSDKQSGPQTPAMSETLGGEEATSKRHMLALKPQESGPALEETSCSDISIGEVRDGELGPFECVKLEVVFTPTTPGKAKTDFHIKFSDPNCEPISIGVEGMAVCAPVWVVQPCIDLKICMFDRLYQDSIVVQSRASTALRLTFEVCPELRNHMDILPKMGYIQARSSFNAQLRFLPRCSFSEDAKTFFDTKTGVLEVPLAVQVADQVRPVPFMVHAVVTSSDLHFDRTDVNFGNCSIFESVKTSVRLTNLSLLPQDYGFLGIPQFMDVQPNNGFGTILPLETMELDLIFSPKKAGEYNFMINCKSGINRDFPLSCHAIGIHPPLELSHSLVHFGATAVGDSSTAVLHIVNKHASRNKLTHPVAPVGPRLFAFVPPENSEITLTPRAGQVSPGQTCMVQVTFRPKLCKQSIREEAVRLLCHSEELRLQELERVTEAEKCRNGGQQEKQCKKETPAVPQKDKKATPTRSQGKQVLKEKSSRVSISHRTESPFRPPNPADIQQGSEEYTAGRASLLNSFSDRYNSYIIPCFVSDREPAQSDSQDQPSCSSPFNTLYLELHCPAVRPPLVITSSNGQTTIDYNQVAVGQKVVKNVTVQNISQEALELRSSVLDLSGPFSLLNALRCLGPGETHTLLVAFIPTSGKQYRETMEIYTTNMTLEVTLCGVGVDPLITSSHQGCLMDFGYVFVKESTSQVFQVHNTSSLAVHFSVLLESWSLGYVTQSGEYCLPSPLSQGPENQTHPNVGTQNYSGLSVFSVKPVEGAIAPGKSQDITVTFLPDHESLHYCDRLRVELMNKSTVCVTMLKGAARSHIMYLSGGDVLAGPTQATHPLPASMLSEDTVHREKIPMTVLLTLRGVYREGTMLPAVRELEVGCIRSTQPLVRKNVEFIWEGLQALHERGFSVEPTRGVIDAGHKHTISVIWTPPRGLKPNEVVQVCAPLILKGDETEVYNVTMLALASRASQEPSHANLYTNTEHTLHTPISKPISK
ncbi:hypothetical protein UPYG_G00008690 [Umbra pygmaea]|uniref:Cilia- and flagella-associated protein 74 n=1 Tax=Umbra pygmaea TaxID=75934 RepID=A0ABD0XZ60_UMBPY